MKEYHIVYSERPPVWNSVPVLSVDCAFLNPGGVTMQQQICYNENCLYVRQSTAEKDIRAEHSGFISPVCEDSCMEFFFAPVFNDNRYFNFEINPNGAAFIGIGTDRNHLYRIVFAEYRDYFHIVPEYTVSGWQLSYSVPLEFIQMFFPCFQFRKGSRIRANCFKGSELSKTPHYISWNPLTSEDGDFHQISDFGSMILD